MGFFGVDRTENEENQYNQQVALNDGGTGISGSTLANVSIESSDAEVSKKALDVAASVANGAYETVYHNYDAMNKFQSRAFDTVNSAVERAENIATNAAPVSAGQYAIATAGQSSKILIVLAGIVGIALLVTSKR